MFGGKKKKAVQHVTNALHPLIMNTQNTIGMPRNFWEDDFVLGFIGFCIAFHMQATSNIQLSQIDKGSVSVDVFTNLSHMNGLPLARKHSELAVNQSNPDFEMGADNAATWIFYIYGSLKDENTNSHVSSASNNGEIIDRETIGTNLFFNLYINVLKERFNLL